VPVYNAENDILRCLDSIFHQHFSHKFEVIAVDDGSTDNSLLVLKNYQSKEPKLKIIAHGINKKLSVARTTGMKAAAGDYIMHVDQDDWLMPDALENLFQKCLETNADVLVFNYVTEDKTSKRISVNNIKKEMITTVKVKVQHLFLGACWSKIVKRALTENMIYGEVGINYTEDLLYATEILLKANKICLLTEQYYVYFTNNSDSITGSVKPAIYLQTQISSLNQIQLITEKYNASQPFTNNLLNYFEKWIYIELAKIHFWHKELITESNQLIRQLFVFPVMTKKRILRLEASMNNKYLNLIEVAWRLQLKKAISILIKSYRK